MSNVSYLPAPTVESWGWQDHAACAGAAKAICATCPVLEQCREYALSAHEPYGIWGGMTEEERAAYWKHEVSLSA